MSEAPKKIWMMENPEAWTTRDDMFNTPYIRADLVDELVEALERIDDFLSDDYMDAAVFSEIIYNALAKARGESHE